ALRDVLGNGDDVSRLASRVALERGGQLDPDLRAVLAHVSLLQPQDGRVAPQQRSIQLDVPSPVVGVRDVLKGFPEQLLTGVSDDGAVRPVDAEETAGGVVVRDANGGVLERAAEPLLALPQRLLGLTEVGDIGGGPEPLDDPACPGAGGGAADCEPPRDDV